VEKTRPEPIPPPVRLDDPRDDRAETLLSVTSEHTTRYRLFRLSGDLDIYTLPRARQMILPALSSKEDARAVFFDLRDLDFMDTKGLTFLLSVLCPGRDAHRNYLRLLIAAPGRQPFRVLGLAALDQLATIVESLEEAVARLEPETAAEPTG
jgi:anti-anti-sigma factor